MSWSDFAVPLVAAFASLPPITLAYLFWKKKRDSGLGLFFVGVVALSAIIFLVTLGAFLNAARFQVLPGLSFLFWNLTFLLSFASLVIFRRFVNVVRGEPPKMPAALFVGSALFYTCVLVLAFGLNPPALDFQGRTASLLGTVYYTSGVISPIVVFLRSLKSAPAWLKSMIESFFRYLLPLGVLVVLWEAARVTNLLSREAFSAVPLLFLMFFGLVTLALFRAVLFETGPSTRTAGEPTLIKAQAVANHCAGEKITRREFEVLVELLEGISNQEIANRLKISASTVKNHIYSLYQKIGTDTRTELMALAEKLAN